MSDTHFSHVEALDRALANTVVTTLTTAIKDRGRAYMVVSGGSTPKGLFNVLAQTDLPWSSVTLTLADERWLPANHVDSNEGMLRRELLTAKASAAQFISLLTAYPDTDKTVAQVCTQLDAIDRYDLVILGMGNDKHTASLFPCAPELPEGLSTEASALMVHPVTAPHARLSQSRIKLLNARRGIVHVVGASKLKTLAEARQSADPLLAPISAFLTTPNPFEVWSAD